MVIKLIQTAIFWCGVAHFGLCLGSIFIPKALHWKTQLAVLNPLLRQMFWTYAGYILTINFVFGLISVLGPGDLIDHTFLAKAVSLLIGTYWLGRIIIQFFYFDRTQAPKGIVFILGEVALVGMFIAFAVVYLVAFFVNNQWI